VLGTTRVGKTRLAELLIAQDIRRGEVVIVFDPKGDVVQPIQICVIHQGKLVPLSEVQEEVLPPLQHKVELLRFGRH